MVASGDNVADTEENFDEGLEEGQGKSKLPLIIGIVLALGLGGSGWAMFFLGGDKGAEGDEAHAEAGEDGEEAADDGHGDKKKKKKKKDAHDDEGESLGHIVKMSDFVVNLADEDDSRYLKIAFQVELDSTDYEADFEANKVRMRHEILLYLSSLMYADTVGLGNKKRMRKALLSLVSQILDDPDAVRNIYITEFMTQ
jgi:flagellar FliL protein